MSPCYARTLWGRWNLAAQRDPEEALEIFEAVLPLMTQAVHRYEGTVNVTTGDGIVALFGAPLAHEDHAIRACYAALQMQEAVNQYAQELQRNATFLSWFAPGCDSGEAVIRPIADDPSGVPGDGPDGRTLAARLGQIAAPGTLLVSAETLRLAKGFVHVKPLEPANGRPRESTYELVGAVPVQTSFQASSSPRADGLCRSRRRNGAARARAGQSPAAARPSGGDHWRARTRQIPSSLRIHPLASSARLADARERVRFVSQGARATSP